MNTPNTPSCRGNFLPAILAVGLGLAFAARQASAQSDIVVFGPSLGGAIEWAAPPHLASFTVEWAPTIAGPWTDSWTSLVNIPNTGEVGTAQVPVFYRIVGRTYPGLLIHGDGTQGSTAITDTRGHIVNVRGHTHIDTGTSRLGDGSIAFDGTDDFLESSPHSDWALGRGDFTVDLWANFSTVSGTRHLIGLHQSNVYTEWSLVFQSSALNVYVNSAIPISHPWIPNAGQWYHLAVTRSAGVIRLFVDGKLVKSAANDKDIANGRNLTIGATVNPALHFHGFLDEVSIMKGRALWTEDFTPPTTPHD